MSKRYLIHGWKKGEIYFWTDKEIYEKVMQDSKSDYNWFTSAKELVKVCNEPKFSKLYAREIRIAILNCFANLEEKCETSEARDNEAVYSCYTSLTDKSEKSERAKRRYLQSQIHSVTDEFRYRIRLLANGPTMKEFQKAWEKAKIDEYILEEKIDFEQLKKDCYAEWEEEFEKRKEIGTLEEDEKMKLTEMREYMNFTIHDLYL